MKPNVEMIVGFKPDLVVRSGTRKEEAAEMDRIRAAGIPTATFSPKSFEEIFSVMERLGVLTGRSDGAKTAVDALRGRLDAVRAKIGSIDKPLRVFFEVRAEPLAAAGNDSIVRRILDAAGAENCIKSDKSVVQYGFEPLLADDPDVYIVQRGPMNRNPDAPGKRPHFDQLRAVREGRVVYVDEFLFSRPGPRCVEAVERLAAELYPDRFKTP